MVELPVQNISMVTRCDFCARATVFSTMGDKRLYATPMASPCGDLVTKSALSEDLEFPL